MAILKGYHIRPVDGRQQQRIEDLILLYGSPTAALRAAIDLLYAQQAQKLEELRPTIEAAQAALEEARQALQE